MRGNFTLRTLKTFVLSAAFVLAGLPANAGYVPVAVTGYNADVVANGTGTATSSITADVDGAGYAFMAADFNPLGALPTSYLPANNTIFSVATSGVKFQLESYAANNSLRLAAISAGTLSFNTAQSASEIFLLGVTGSGAGTATITVTFTDASTQVFGSVAVPDWYGGANFAIRGLGRVNVASNGIDNNPSDPRLYEIKLSVSAANYSKQIASVNVSKTTTTGVINIMGVAINTVAPCATPANQPVALGISTGATTATPSFNAAIPAADKYLVVRTPAGAALSTPPVNGTTYAVNGALGNGTVIAIGNATSVADAGLTPNTLYRYTIFAYNDLCSGGPVYNTTAPLTATATTLAATFTNVPATGYTADVVANGPGNASASITADVDGAGYAFMAPDYNPSGTIFPTSFLPATGLVNSAFTPGVSFQLQSYSSNNSLRLAATATGTLTLNTPTAASDLYLLAVTGSGAGTANVTVTFSDLTTQVFNNVSVPDWYGGANYAILGLGRVNVPVNTIDNNTANPRLYEVKLTILAANYGKQIASVTVVKATTVGVINVMGLAAAALPPCVTPAGGPSGLVLAPGASSVNVAFTGSSPAAQKYMIVRTTGATLTASPVNGSVYTPGSGLGNGTIISVGNANNFTDANLTPSTLYRYTVFAYNDLCAGGPLYNTASPVTATTTTTGGTTYTWTGATNYTWTVPTNWTPARSAPDPSDILLFNNGLTNAVYGIPTQTVRRIVFSNNTIAHFQSSTAVTLTLASDNNGATNELDIAAGSTMLCNGSALPASSLTIAFSGTGATANIAGNLESYSLVTFAGNNIFNFTNAVATVAPSGTLTEGGTQTTASIQGNTTANLIVNGTLNYKYTSTNNPAMPTATWNTGSTTKISGFNSATGGPNGGMNQVFFDFVYDCKSQVSNTNWSGNGPLIATGTCSMISTGTGTLQFSSTQGYNYQVENFVQTGGTLNLNSGTATATPVLNISGTFNQTGGVLTATGGSSGANAPTLHFNGTLSTQNVNFFNAAPVGPVVYRISNPYGINLTGSGTLTSAFNINTNGGVRISSVANNPVTTSLAMTYNATATTLTYDAPASYTMTADVFPVTAGPVNLSINTGGSANVIAMPFARTVPGTLTMTSGDINVGANTLTLGTSAAAPGALAYTAGFIRVGAGGTFRRWYGTAGLPTAAGTGVGFYPVGYLGLGRSVALYFNSATALTTGGTIAVSHTNVPGFTNGLSVADGAYVIDTRTNSSWTFASSGVALGGSINMQITGTGLFTSNNPANLRAMQANAVAGAHVPGFGSTAVRTGLSLSDISVPYYIGAAAADITGVYTAVNTGNWSAGSTWDIGTAPGFANDAFINPGVVVTSNAATNTSRSLNILPGGTLNIAAGNTVTIDSALQNNGTVNLTGGTMTVNGRNYISGITNNGGALVSVSSGVITLGPAGGSARPFVQNGTMTVTGGTFNVNGNLSTATGSVITQSGGNINVDGNAGGVLANSVACGTPIVSFVNAANSFTGGTFTVVDPHTCNTGTNTMVYNNPANITASGTHVFRMGDGVSTDPGGQTPYNFSVNTSLTSTGKFSFNDLVINTGTAVNSYFVQGSATMGVLRDLIVNSGGEFRNNAATQTTYVNNNLVSNAGGTFTGLGTVAFANFSSGAVVASTSSQNVSGGGIFRNTVSATPAAKFNSILMNNSGGGVTFNIGDVRYSGTLTFTLGKMYMGTAIMIQNAGAGVTGPSQTTGWVVGRFQKNALAGGLAHFYPVGDALYYTQLNLNGTAATAGDIIVGGYAGDHPNIATSLINPNKSVNRYWSIQQINGFSFTAAGPTVQPVWNPTHVDAPANTANFVVGKYTAGTWSLPAVSAPLPTSIVAAVPLTSADGDYQVGETCSPINITTAPASQAVCSGTPVTFSVGLSGTSGVLYQWLKNGTPIPGATTSAYSIPGAVAADAGSYTVQLSSECGAVATVVSVAAVLSVSNPPVISTQPVSQAICQDLPVTFSVTATGTGITYQWQKNGIPIPGATGSTYSIVSVQTADGGNYTVVVNGTSPCANAVSSIAVLTVNPLPLTITAATSTIFCVGGNVVLNATPGYIYQWKLNGNNIGGATGSSYTASLSGNYSAAISSGAGCSGTSNTISVIANSAPPSAFTPGPAATFCAGSTVTLSTPGIAGLTYQWNLNGSPITGATATSFAAGIAGSYTLTVSAGSGCSSVSTATIVTSNPVPPATITPGSATTFCQGGSVTLTANATPGVTYVWNVNGSPVVPAATAISYTANTPGSYTVTVTYSSTGCPSTSQPTAVVVNPLPVATNTPAGPTTFCPGSSVTLNANTGTGLSYNWHKDGFAISPPATGASYVATTAGVYHVVVTNTATGCSQTSSTATVTLNALPGVTVTASGSPTICAGSSVTFSVPTAVGLNYQWKVAGNPIPGATSSSYTVSGGGTYSVTVTNNSTGCTATSINLVTSVVAAPAATLAATGLTTKCQGDTVFLNANSGAGLSYEWRQNGVAVPSSGTAAYSATAGGSYTVVVTNANGCSTTSPAIAVTINPVPSNQISYTTPIIFCEGGGVVLISNAANAVSYQWSNNGVPVPGLTSNFALFTATGAYSVKATNSFGCSSQAQPVFVVVHPVPQPVITNTGNGMLSTGNYASYQWFFNNLPVNGATSPSINYSNNGFYKVEVTDANGCSAMSAAFGITGVGIASILSAGVIKTYPNPVRDILHIDSPVPVDIVIRDVTGRKVLKQAAATEVDMSSLADGAYVLYIVDRNGNPVITEKLLKSSR